MSANPNEDDAKELAAKGFSEIWEEREGSATTFYTRDDSGRLFFVIMSIREQE